MWLKTDEWLRLTEAGVSQLLRQRVSVKAFGQRKDAASAARKLVNLEGRLLQTDECAKLSPASTDKKALRLFKAQRPPLEEARSGEGRPPSSLPDNEPAALPLRRGP
jgi:hypothetical protein